MVFEKSPVKNLEKPNEKSTFLFHPKPLEGYPFCMISYVSYMESLQFGYPCNGFGWFQNVEFSLGFSMFLKASLSKAIGPFAFVYPRHTPSPPVSLSGVRAERREL